MTTFKIPAAEIRVHGAIEAMTTRLGLPEGFLNDLYHGGDDWSFVIKTCALVETALTDFLVRTVNVPLLESEFRGQPLRSKLKWARKLGALSGERMNFVERLLELRNGLAHQIRAIPSFTLATYLDELQEKNSAHFTQLTGSPPATNNIMRALATGIERYGIWLAALLLIIELEDEEVKTQQKRESEFNAQRQADIDALLKLLAEMPDQGTPGASV